MLSRHRNIVDAHVLVVSSTNFETVALDTWHEQVDKFASRTIRIDPLEHEVVFTLVKVKVKKTVFKAVLCLESRGEHGLANLALEVLPKIHLNSR